MECLITIRNKTYVIRHVNCDVRGLVIRIKKYLLIPLAIGTVFYLGLYTYFYSIQDDRFKSVTLPQDYVFNFQESFEELDFKRQDDGSLSALLFKANNSKGVVCFWKGNGGSLQQWGGIAPRFLKCNYDVMITDYRMHGKSKGDITIDNFYSDSQAIYDFLKKRYPENRIICNYCRIFSRNKYCFTFISE